jgi:hypothetical protein
LQTEPSEVDPLPPGFFVSVHSSQLKVF